MFNYQVIVTTIPDKESYNTYKGGDQYMDGNVIYIVYIKKREAPPSWFQILELVILAGTLIELMLR